MRKKPFIFIKSIFNFKKDFFDIFRDGLCIKALASARGSEKKIEKKIRKKIKKNVPVPIYVFVDSEQKPEFKAKIKPCSHQLNCMKFLL